MLEFTAMKKTNSAEMDFEKSRTSYISDHTGAGWCRTNDDRNAHEQLCGINERTKNNL